MVCLADPGGSGPHCPVFIAGGAPLQKAEGQRERNPGLQSERGREDGTGGPPRPWAPAPLCAGQPLPLSVPENGGKGPALMPLVCLTNEETESRSSPGAPRAQQGRDPWQRRSVRARSHRPGARERPRSAADQAARSHPASPKPLTPDPVGQARPSARSQHRSGGWAEVQEGVGDSW